MEKLLECICGILSLALLTLTWARLIRKGTRWELPTHFTGQPFKYSEPANYLDIERKGRSPMISFHAGFSRTLCKDPRWFLGPVSSTDC